jgi:Rhodopirellula transposase DDE domain
MSKSLPDGMTDEEAWFATKWNRIERRLFCRITQNWNGRLLTDRIAVVERRTHRCDDEQTKARLKVECALDERTCGKGIRVPDAEMDAFTSPAMRPIRHGTIQSNQTLPAAESQQLLLWVS